MGLMLITIPIMYLIIVKSLGYDPIRFGVMVVKVIEIGMGTPPVGRHLYVLEGLFPEHSFKKIFAGSFQFVIAGLITLTILTLFPNIPWTPITHEALIGTLSTKRRDKMRELRTTNKLILTVAPTGGFQGKEANPSLPLQPAEIAQSVYEAWNEGASIVHIHARERKNVSKGTTDPDVLREIDKRIREKKCDIIIQHSTANDYIPRLGPDRRIKAIEMNPEMASLDITFTRMITFGGKESIDITTLPEIEYGAKVMLEKGIKPELEVFNPVVMEDVYYLVGKGLLKKPYWISFVMGMHRINRAYMHYSPKLLIFLIDLLPPDSMFTVMGIATDELPATTQSILLGGHLRVGFEDNVYYKKGQLAGSNAQLVARAARIGRELGCDIASPAEARQMIGIPPRS
jgi:3-keto-5-aminohexanoate cleavage enzyme